jgi:hypothetical protein
MVRSASVGLGRLGTLHVGVGSRLEWSLRNRRGKHRTRLRNCDRALGGARPAFRFLGSRIARSRWPSDGDPSWLRSRSRSPAESPVEQRSGARILRAEPVHDPLAVPLGAHEPAPLENLEVPGRARLGEAHLARQLRHEAATSLEQANEPEARGLTEACELGAELLRLQHCMCVHITPGSLTATPWLC